MSHGPIEDIAAEIGFTAACRLVVWFGKCSIAVPNTPIEGHILTIVLGEPAMKRLCAAFGGETIYIQSTSALIESERTDVLIALMIVGGYSTKGISEVIGWTERIIQKRRRDLEDRGIIPVIMTSGWPYRKKGMHENVHKLIGETCELMRLSRPKEGELCI